MNPIDHIDHPLGGEGRAQIGRKKKNDNPS
jgi:hypothetical protein